MIGDPSKEHRTNKPPLDEYRKGQKEMPCVLQPPRILLAGIHLGGAIRAPPGRTLCQKDWPETTWKLTPPP